MSLHPLNPELLVTQTLVTAGAGAGGVALRHHGRSVLAMATGGQKFLVLNWWTEQS